MTSPCQPRTLCATGNPPLRLPVNQTGAGVVQSEAPVWRDGNAPPASIERLPKHGALPIPYFTLVTRGRPDFRYHDVRKHNHAMEARLCGVCGTRCKPFSYWFLLGPNQYATRSETYMPASHKDCLRWSMAICPWLAGKTERRTSEGLQERHVGGRVVCVAGYSTVIVPESSSNHLYAALGTFAEDHSIEEFMAKGAK